jgi:uncharacterized protein (TIGR02246 family)
LNAASCFFLLVFIWLCSFYGLSRATPSLSKWSEKWGSTSVPGREPFGKEAFAATFEGTKGGVRMEGTNEIRELRILGDWAYLRAHIAVTMTPPGGEPARRSGYTLTILRKDPDGRWRLFRDANMLAPERAG